jgi:hypothetical protein
MSPPDPNPEDMREIHLGRFNLAHIGAAAGHGKVSQATTFYIEDVDGFGIFAKWLVSQPQFTWQVRCPEVHAEGFSFFPVYKQLNFVKDVIINGLDNFHDVKILVSSKGCKGNVGARLLTSQLYLFLRSPSSSLRTFNCLVMIQRVVFRLLQQPVCSILHHLESK